MVRRMPSGRSVMAATVASVAPARKRFPAGLVNDSPLSSGEAGRAASRPSRLVVRGDGDRGGTLQLEGARHVVVGELFQGFVGGRLAGLTGHPQKILGLEPQRMGR